VCDPQ